MSKLTRRDALKLMAAGCTGLMFRALFEPRLLLAQSAGGGDGKNLIFINMLGGVDGLAAYPYYAGQVSTIVNSELRPTLRVDPGSVLSIDPQTGISNKIGLHPAFQPLVNVAASNMKLVHGYGIPGDPGRSHDTCQILYSLGLTELQGGDMVGFLARLMDRQNWDTFQYWALSETNAPDINTTNNPPVTIREIDGFNYGEFWWENNGERALALEIQDALIEIQNPSGQVGGMVDQSLKNMHESVSVVRNYIAPQTAGNNAAGNYTDDRLGRGVRDAARILRAKATSDAFGYRDKDTLILLSQDGYDTHSDQNAPGNEWNLGNLLGSLATNLAVLYTDLANFGILDNTIIALYSEFGRTNYENGDIGEVYVGTDHGHANNTLILGGPIQSGVIGAAPSANELRADYNALLPKVDYRDIFSDLIAWLGANPNDIFDDPNYTRSPLGII